jgi:hypothetical protein
MRASKLQPALLGGVVIGVLSALPVISAGNCLCCLWVILGGILATYLLQQAQPTTPVEAADGAIVGLLAGLVGAVVGTIVAIPVQMLMGSMGGDALRQILEQSGGDMPAEVRDAFEQMSRGGIGGALMFVVLLVSLVVNAIFGAIGGALGTTLFKPSVPPPPPVPGFADSSRPHTPE